MCSEPYSAETAEYLSLLLGFRFLLALALLLYLAVLLLLRRSG